jgi:hypothetical protein
MERGVSPVPSHLRADPRRSRLTVVELVYYQQVDAQFPVSYDHRFGCAVESTEQAYVRLTEADEDWKKVETGWIKEASMVVIKNEAGKYNHNPTEEKRVAEEAKILEVSLVPHSSPPCSCLCIRPQQSQRITPTELSRLKIRCARGSARYTVVAVPL